MSFHPRMGKQSKTSVQIQCDELMSLLGFLTQSWVPQRSDHQEVYQLTEDEATEESHP